MKIIKNLRLLLGAEANIMATTKGIGIVGKEERVLSLFVLLVRSLNEDIEEETLREAFELGFKSDEELNKIALKKMLDVLKKQVEEK